MKVPKVATDCELIGHPMVNGKQCPFGARIKVEPVTPPDPFEGFQTKKYKPRNSHLRNQQ